LKEVIKQQSNSVAQVSIMSSVLPRDLWCPGVLPRYLSCPGVLPRDLWCPGV